MQTARDSEQNGSDQSDCSMYSRDNTLRRPSRTLTVTAEAAMMVSAEACEGISEVWKRLRQTQRCYPVVCRPQRRVSASSDVRLFDRALAILVKQQISLFSEVAPQLGRDLRRGSPPSNTAFCNLFNLQFNSLITSLISSSHISTF